MHRTLLLFGLLMTTACTSGAGGDPGDDDDSAGDDLIDDDDATEASGGCGQVPPHGAGRVALTLDAGPEGDGTRGFYLSVPAGYDPDVPSALVVGYPGTNWLGEQVQPYLGLESVEPQSNEIFVYPDPLWHDFAGWGNLGGWILGPYAQPADGNEDLVFTEALLDWVEANYCVDTERVFATGHSWGGDMAQVVSCFLGERFTASVPVAANRPYWFEAGTEWVNCSGETAVWTMFGVADDHFTSQAWPGEYGDECRDFWLDTRDCDGADSYTDLGFGEQDECVEFTGCSSPVRYCLYGPDTAHQVPAYYAEAAMEFFRGF